MQQVELFRLHMRMHEHAPMHIGVLDNSICLLFLGQNVTEAYIFSFEFSTKPNDSTLTTSSDTWSSFYLWLSVLSTRTYRSTRVYQDLKQNEAQSVSA